MALGNKIGIGGIWLTDDGTENGSPCVIDTQGDFAALKMKWWGAASRNARGNPEMNLTEVAGVDLIFLTPTLPKAAFDALVVLFDDALDNDEDFPLLILNEVTGDLDLTAMPNPDLSISWKETVEDFDFVFDVEIRVITTTAEEEGD